MIHSYVIGMCLNQWIILWFDSLVQTHTDNIIESRADSLIQVQINNIIESI